MSISPAPLRERFLNTLGQITEPWRKWLNEISGSISATDPHTQYALLAGRSGGQTLYGGIAASENLIFESTSHSTKGRVGINDHTLYINTNYVSGDEDATLDFNNGMASIKLEYLNEQNWRSFTLNNRTYIHLNESTPTTPLPVNYVAVEGKGDNTTFKGVSGAFFKAKDRSDVTVSNKGVLYAAQFSVEPIVDRNNYPYDDVACIVCVNEGIAKATECIYVGHNSGITGSEWYNIIGLEAFADNAIKISGTYTAYGIDLKFGTYSVSSIRIPNNQYLVARNAVDNADVNLIKLNASNLIELGTVTFIGGNLYVSGAVLVYSDAGAGLAGTLELTNVSNSSVSTGAGSIKMCGTTVRDSTGFIKIYDGVTIRYIPFFDTITG